MNNRGGQSGGAKRTEGRSRQSGMFQVDRSGNRLVRLEQRRFAALSVRERGHLQEWLVRMPDASDEELL